MPIKAIAFDLDDTLWPCMPTILAAEQKVFNWLEKNYPLITNQYSQQDIFQLRKKLMRENRQLQIDLSLMRKTLMRLLAREFGYEEEQVSQTAFEIFYRHRHEVSLYDDVLPALTLLKNHYVLGSISNGNANAQLTELKNVLKHSLSASEVGELKPEAVVFHRFCELAGCSPDECVYVGDDIDVDIHGATNAGMKAVWLDRENKESEISRLPQGVTRITTLSELSALEF